MTSIAIDLPAGKTSLDYLNAFGGLTPKQRKEALEDLEFNCYFDAVLFQGFGPVYRAVYKKRDRQDALHDLIVKLGRKPDHLLPEFGQDVYAWVMTVVTNHLRDDYRQRSNRERILREHQDEIAQTVMQALHDQSRDPADIICGTIPVELPPGQAQVAVLLSYGYTQVETAAILGVTPDAVFQRLSKIRRKMQDVAPSKSTSETSEVSAPKAKKRGCPPSGYDCCGRKKACPQHKQQWTLRGTYMASHIGNCGK